MAKTIRFILGLISVLTLGVLLHPAAAYAACSSPAGQTAEIVYNSDAKVFQYCNGTDWVRMSQEAGSGSGGCNLGAAGTFAEGELIYDKDTRTLTGCTGSTQTALGPVGGGKHGWLQVAVGESYTCGIRTDNKLYCWGANSLGRTGLGVSSGQARVPAEVTGGGSWKQVAVSTYHTCGIKSDDTLWCWGYNVSGQLGDNSTTQRLVPTAVNGGGTWKQVDVGQGYHTCGIKSDDTLWCWGNNANGRTGLNTAAGNTLVPTQISGGGTWKQVSAGNEHACGIMSDDTARCWGRNNNGEIGDNSSTQRLVPTALNGGGTWKQISTGGSSHTCGIRMDDTARCWGANWSGQLGDNSITLRLVPTALSGGGTWKRVSAGSGHTCGVRSDDTMRCWGSNSNGKLGDNTLTSRTVPTALYSGGVWKYMDVGGNNTCGIRLDDVLYCWGSNNYSQLGENTAPETAVPLPLTGNTSWKQVSIGTYSACGIKSDDKLYCWGENYEGEMGYGAQYDYSSQPGEVSGGGSWKFLSASNGRYHTCGIKSDDTLWCWGANDGRLGDNTTTRRLVPTAVSGGGTWKFVSGGSAFTCGIKSDDTLWCWGINGSGQLGDNSITTRLVPTAVNGGGTWLTVSAANGYACAIKLDNTLWCWGSNSDGRTGLNTAAGTTLVPTQVSGGGSWQQVVTGYNATCGLKTDGSAWCWGTNWYGNLGDGTYDDSLVPVAVSGGHTWKQIAFADNIDYQWAHVCAVKTDNTVWCWGANDSGQLGNGTFDDSLVPALANGGNAWAQVTVNSGNTYAISIKGGQLYGWGLNDYAKLMDDDTIPLDRMTGVTPACSDPTGVAGTLLFNADHNVMQYCDGVGWVRVGK
ncbi:MAG: hypothetical protein NDJ24_07145 [Alphaproteobacteria bacterium]|nr:hypothetical protein [Alphaproteobacteria bacterium]